MDSPAAGRAGRGISRDFDTMKKIKHSGHERKLTALASAILASTLTTLSVGTAWSATPPVETGKPNFDAYFDNAARAAASVASGAVVSKSYSMTTAQSVAALSVASRLSQRKVAGYASNVDASSGQTTFLWASSKASAGGVATKSTAAPEAAGRSALSNNASLLGLDRTQIADASLVDSSTLKSGAVITRFQQRQDGLEVFGRSLSVLMSSDMKPVAISGYFATAANTDSSTATAAVVSKSYVSTASNAISVAVSDMTDGHAGISSSAAASTATKSTASDASAFVEYATTLTSGSDLRLSRPVRGKEVYYPTASGLRQAYYVEVIGQTVDGATGYAYGYVVDAANGDILFRKNLTASDAFNYRVFADADGNHHPYDNPLGNDITPMVTPDPDGTITRVSTVANLVSLQSGPISTNDPWLPDGANTTSGNNVDAYADLAEPDGYSAGTLDVQPFITSANTFDYPIAADLDPTEENQQDGAIVNLFYLNNWLHDWWYDHGFNEVAGNAQLSNYGRGGVEGDPIHAEAQDYSRTDNANMTTPADGGSPIEQMYLWDGLLNGSVTVTDPSSLGSFAWATADFGPDAYSIQAPVADMDDGTDPVTDGCEATSADYTGKIVLIDRGTCEFGVKTLTAQNAGAAAVIVVNNVAGAATSMGVGASDANSITIPAVMISMDDGATLRSAMADGTVTLDLERESSVPLDGTIDYQIVAHEFFHHISNRLVNNGSGLVNYQGMGMGEGWSDFDAMLMTVRESDLDVASNVNWSGAYALSTYVSDNPYFGIRRTPYSTDFNYDPLTFKDIEYGVALPEGGTYLFGDDGSYNNEVHAAGEIWCNTLWEVYAAMLNSGRYTLDEARSQIMDYVIGGLKLTPYSPTFLEARDALLAVARATNKDDFELMARAFAKRGMGINAVAPPRSSTLNSGVVESYDALGIDYSIANVSVDMSQSSDPHDNDDVLDLDESGTMTISLLSTGMTGTSDGIDVTLSMPGVEFPNGNVVHFPAADVGELSTVDVAVKLDSASPAELKTLTLDFTDPDPTDDVILMEPTLSTDVQVDFNLSRSRLTDDFEEPAASERDWTTEFSGSGDGWALSSDYGDYADRTVFHVPDNDATSDASLVTPAIQVGSGADFTFSFDHFFAFEPTVAQDATTGENEYYDGGVLEISVDGGAWEDVFDEGATVVSGSGYNGRLVDPDRAAFVDEASQGTQMLHESLSFGASLAGHSVQLRFRQLTDVGTGAFGWMIDNVAVSGAVSPFLGIVADDHSYLDSTVANPLTASLTVASGSTHVLGDTITLDASGSTSSNDAALSYNWTQLSGPQQSLQGQGTSSMSFTPAAVGDYRVRLKITDVAGNAATAETTISIVPVGTDIPDETPPGDTPTTSTHHSGGGALSPGLLLPMLLMAWRRRRQALRGKGPMAAVALAASAMSPVTQADDGYTFRTFSADTEHAGTQVLGMNDKGEVVGYYWATGYGASTAFVREPDGTLTPLIYSGDYDAAAVNVATAINNSGRVVGYSNFDSWDEGWMYNPLTKSYTDIRYPGAQATEAEGIDDQGRIVGNQVTFTTNDDFTQTGFLRDVDGSWSQIAPPGATLTTVYGISPDGTITGWYADSTNYYRSFVRSPDGEYSVYDVKPAGGSTSVFLDVNAVGQVAGYSTNLVTYLDTGIVYDTVTGVLTTLQVPGQIGNVHPFGIDADGSIAGYADVATADGGTETVGFVACLTDNTQCIFDAPQITVPADFVAYEREGGSAEQATIELPVTLRNPQDGKTYTYRWEQSSGTSVELTNADQATASFTAPKVSANTVLGFDVVVSDGTTESRKALNVTVLDVSVAPKAVATTSGTPMTKKTITLDGTGSSDDDGDALTYVWTQVSGPADVSISNANTAKASFETSKAGDYEFELTVTDSSGASSKASVSVAVSKSGGGGGAFGPGSLLILAFAAGAATLRRRRIA